MKGHTLVLGALCALSLHTAVGQIPAGSFALMNTAGGTVGFWQFTPPLGFLAISNVPSQLSTFGSSMEVDLLTGDFLVGTSSTTGGSQAEIWRCVLSGTTMVSATRVALLAGSNGSVLEMTRDREGCILALGQAAGGAPLLYRVAVSPAGTAVVSVPITAPAGTTFRDITVGPTGFVHLASFATGAGAGSTLYIVPPAGGTLVATPTTYSFTVTDIESTLSAGIMAGGLATAIPGGNFSCPAVPSFFYATNPPFSDIINEIAEDANLTTWVVANAAGQSVNFWTMGACNPPGTLVSSVAGLGTVLKLVPVSSSFKYGCACPNPAGTMAVINQGLPAPSAGGVWNLFLNNSATPNTPAFLAVGTSSIPPTPVFGSGCLLLNNLQAIQSTTTDAFGVAGLVINLPAGLAGTTVHAQWAYLSGVPGGVGTTGGLAAQL